MKVICFIYDRNEAIIFHASMKIVRGFRYYLSFEIYFLFRFNSQRNLHNCLIEISGFEIFFISNFQTVILSTNHYTVPVFIIARN